MKIVITAGGNNLESNFDLRFGRAAWFCLYNDQTGKIKFIENESANANSGAGVKASEMMVELEVSKVISGDFGPKAKDLLDKFNIQMVVMQDDTDTIEGIINKLK